jgi:transcription termination factor Rho
MTESIENPSLLTDEATPKKVVRRKAASAAKEANAQQDAIASTAPKARASRTTSTATASKLTPIPEEPTASNPKPEAKKKVAAKAKRTTEEPSPVVPEPEAKPIAKKTRSTRAKASEASEASEAAEPLEKPAPHMEALKKPVRARTTGAKTAKPLNGAAESGHVAPTSSAESAPVSHSAEEWRPGRASEAPKIPEAIVIPRRANAEQTPATETSAAQNEPSAQGQPQSRDSRPQRNDRFGRDRRDHRRDNQRDRFGRNNRDRSGGSQQGHQAPQQAQQREAGQPHHGLSREERIAAARQDFTSTPAVDEPKQEPVFAEGIVEVSGKGFGFLRDAKRNFAQHPSDVFVTPEVCRSYTLRDGMWIRGEIRRGSRGPQLFKLTAIEGEDPEKHRVIPMFDELTTINPNRWIKMETAPERYTTRVIDLMAPIGRGQRGIIVAPPRTGKTTLLQHIADAVIKNHSDMKLMILLVDERPEEVTEIRRTVPSAEILASSNDQDIKSHTRIAQLAIERAKRLVEMGKHVFLLLDSITRVGRAFNNAMGGGGRTMSGGMDARALEIPRKLFAAARNTEEAGSLTIIATALIETGSRMDDLIFQEFKGTGNMELVLDRKISDMRIYPAVDIFQSGTRREELLLPDADLHKINIIRRGLAGHKPVEAVERLLSFLRRFPTNAQMLREIPG